jgi:hypothetical protein
MSDFSAIFHSGLKCCLYCLNYWITFTKGLSNWEKVIKNNKNPQASQQRPKLQQKKHGPMLLVKKNHQKTARDLN